MRNSIRRVQKSKISFLSLRVLWHTEGHRNIAFYCLLVYIFVCIFLGRETDAGALSALLMLYGAAQAKDAFNDRRP